MIIIIYTNNKALYLKHALAFTEHFHFYYLFWFFYRKIHVDNLVCRREWEVKFSSQVLLDNKLWHNITILYGKYFLL